MSVIAGCGQSNPDPTGSLANPSTLTTDPPRQAPAPLPAADSSRVIARVGKSNITLGMLHGPLLEAYGLSFLQHLVVRELARERLTRVGLSLAPQELEEERFRLMDQAFHDSVDPDRIDPKMTEAQRHEFRRKEYERLMEQLLQMRRISKAEYAMAVETSTILRKVAQHELKDKLKDEDVQEAFRVKYGEKAKVRHIQLSNRREAAEALRRINEEHKSFEQVARAMSKDERSREQGGLIRPFSRAERLWPLAFKETAFSLKQPNEISDPVDTGDAVHLIQLIEKIPPSAVRYEDHREIVRMELMEVMVGFRMQQLRQEIATESLNTLLIEDPVLRQQYIVEKDRRSTGAIKDGDAIRSNLTQGRPTTREAERPSGPERPPATQPAGK